MINQILEDIGMKSSYGMTELVSNIDGIKISIGWIGKLGIWMDSSPNEIFYSRDLN